MKYNVSLGEEVVTVDVRRNEQGWLVSVDGGPEEFLTRSELSAGEWNVGHNGTMTACGVAATGDKVAVQLHGQHFSMEVVDPRESSFQLGGSEQAGVVTTSMPGAVVSVLVGVGDTVKKSQPLLVIEAMKMENEFRAPCDGTVKEVLVRPGEVLESGATLMLIEPAVSS